MQVLFDFESIFFLELRRHHDASYITILHCDQDHIIVESQCLCFASIFKRSLNLILCSLYFIHKAEQNEGESKKGKTPVLEDGHEKHLTLPLGQT